MKFATQRKLWGIAALYVVAGGLWTGLLAFLWTTTASTVLVVSLQAAWLAATAGLLWVGFRRARQVWQRADLLRRASQERYQQLAENTAGFLYRYRLTPPAGFEDVSASALAILGLSPEALYVNPALGRPLLQAADQPQLETVAEQGGHVELPTAFTWTRPDQTLVALEQHYRLVHNDAGQLTAIQSVVRDVTERKRAEKALISEMRFVSVVLETAESLVFIVDAQGRITGFNRACERLTGYAFDEVRGRPVWELFLGPEEAQAAQEEFQDLQADQFPLRHQNAWLTRNGGRRLIDWAYAALTGEQGQLESVVGIGIDITERRAAEDSLQLTAESLKVWVDRVERHDRDISLLNKMGEMLQNCTSAQEAYEVIAQSGRQLFPAGALYIKREAENVLESVAGWGEGLSGSKHFATTDCWALRRGQAYLVPDTQAGLLCPHLQSPPPASYLCVPLKTQSEPLGILYLEYQANGTTAPEAQPDRQLLAAQQVALTASEQMALALANLKLRETLRGQAIRDPLTGLFNRRYLEESLEREMHRAARNKTPLSLIIMDLDHFKHFNDTFGHDAGDLVLCEIGRLLKANVRGADIPCRYGGEEFLLVLPEASLEAAQQRAELVREGVKQIRLAHLGDPLGPLTLSLGVAVYPQHGASAEEVLRTADRALYRAKAEGRDRVVTAHVAA